jgi:hypothetical protein
MIVTANNCCGYRKNFSMNETKPSANPSAPEQQKPAVAAPIAQLGVAAPMGAPKTNA